MKALMASRQQTSALFVWGSGHFAHRGTTASRNETAVVAFAPGATAALSVVRSALAQWGAEDAAKDDDAAAALVGGYALEIHVGGGRRLLVPAASKDVSLPASAAGCSAELVAIDALRRYVSEAIELRGYNDDLSASASAAATAVTDLHNHAGAGQRVQETNPNTATATSNGDGRLPTAVASEPLFAYAPLSPADLEVANRRLAAKLKAGVVAPDLVCAVCCLLPSDPVFASCCGATLCRACAHTTAVQQEDDDGLDGGMAGSPPGGHHRGGRPRTTMSATSPGGRPPDRRCAVCYHEVLPELPLHDNAARAARVADFVRAQLASGVLNDAEPEEDSAAAAAVGGLSPSAARMAARPALPPLMSTPPPKYREQLRSNIPSSSNPAAAAIGGQHQRPPPPPPHRRDRPAGIQSEGTRAEPTKKVHRLEDGA